jgi:hypothetical protein
MNKKYFLVFFFLMLLLCFSFNTFPNLNASQHNPSSNQYKLTSYDILSNWTEIEIVSTASTSTAKESDLVVDSAGNIHVVWSDSTDLGTNGVDNDIFYKRWDALTSVWSGVEVVSTESTTHSWKPSIEIDSFGNIHVAWTDLTDYGGSGSDYDIFYKFWNASTSFWNLTEVISNFNTGDSSASRGPSIAIDLSDNVYIAWNDDMDFPGAGTDYDIYFKYFDTTISQWTSIELVSTESTEHSYDPKMVVDDFDDVYIVWEDITDYLRAGTDFDIFYKERDSETQTWTITEVVSIDSLGARLPDLDIDFLGNLHLTYQEGKTFVGDTSDLDIAYKMLDFSLGNWTDTRLVSSESTDRSWDPSISVDSKGKPHIVWKDEDTMLDSGSDLDIYYKTMLSEYLNIWTPVELVSDICDGFSESPALFIDSSDTVNIIWEDMTALDGFADLDIFIKRLGFVPEAPFLEFIVPNPTDVETFSLAWNLDPTVDLYHVYRSSSFINDVDGLTPIESLDENQYFDSLPSEGIYYFVVVAENDFGNSLISNCQYIHYKIPHVQEFVITSVLIFTVLLIISTVSRNRKRKNR